MTDATTTLTRAGYRQTEFGLTLGTKLIRAFSYVAHPDYIVTSLVPYTWYKDFVISGAREHGLPREYIRILESQDADADPDPDREQKERDQVVK